MEWVQAEETSKDCALAYVLQHYLLGGREESEMDTEKERPVRQEENQVSVVS